MGCGSKDTSAGVAQLDKVNQETLINPSNQTATPTVNTPENTSVPSSTSTNVQDQTDEEIATAFEQVGIPGNFHLGAAEIFDMLNNCQFGKETPENFDSNRTLNETVSILAESLILSSGRNK